MANRFNFVSPGAAMGDAFVQALMQREAMRRQAMLDEQERVKQASAIALAQQQEARMRDAEARMAKGEERMLAGQEQDWARERTDRAGANEKITSEERTRLAAAGYGGRTDERLESRTAAVPIMPFAANSPTTTPTSSEGGIFLRPGFQYEQAREAAEERAAQRAAQDEAARVRASENATAAAERAREGHAAAFDRAQYMGQIQLLIAGMNNAQKAGAAAEKKELADKLKDVNTQASIQMRDDVIYRVDQLIGVDPKTKQAMLKPGVGSLFGSTEGNLPGGTGTNAFLAGIIPGGASGKDVGSGASALQGLISLLDVNTIRTMKEQSRTGATGFGALSEKELAVLENAATTLATRTMDEASALKELVKIRNEMVKARAAAQRELVKPQTPPAGGGGTATGGARILSRRPAGQ